MAHWSWGASFPGDSEGSSSASSHAEEESSSLASASSPEKLPDFLRQAAEDGDIETVNAWLRTEPDINARDGLGRPLIYSAVRGTSMHQKSTWLEDYWISARTCNPAIPLMGSPCYMSPRAEKVSRRRRWCDCFCWLEQT